MVAITGILVQAFSLEHLDVSWTLSDTREDLSGFGFIIERSESPEGPFTGVSGLLSPSRDSYRDDTVDLFDRWRIFYYRVRLRKPSGTAATDHISPVGFRGNAPDHVALEIHRGIEKQLRTQIGAPTSILLRRRTFGQPCPQCFDTLRQRKTSGACTLCFGLEFTGGFFDPIPLFINYAPSAKAIRLAAFNEMTPSDTTAEMSGYPLMRPKSDILVTRTNRRWRVEDVRERARGGFIFRQILRLKEIPLRDVLYQFPVTEAMFVLPEDAAELRLDAHEPDARFRDVA